MCRLYPFWRAALMDAGYQPIVVSPVRHPLEVAKSLASRNKMTLQAGLRLWLTHVLEAEISSREDPRHIMLWPGFISDWRNQIAQIASLGGLNLLQGNLNHDKVAEFLDPKFRRQTTDEAFELPPIMTKAYGALSILAHSGKDGEALSQLDEIRLEWADDARLFYDGPSLPQG